MTNPKVQFKFNGITNVRGVKARKTRTRQTTYKYHLQDLWSIWRPKNVNCQDYDNEVNG